MVLFRKQTTVALALALVATGCLAATGPGLDAVDEATGAIRIGQATAAVGEMALFQGRELQGECPSANDCVLLSAPFSPHRPYAVCGEENCERTPLVLAQGGSLFATARWAVQDDDFAGVPEYLGAEHVHIRVGVLLAGAADDEIRWLDTAKYGAYGLLEDIAPGEYELVAQADWGRGAYEVSLRLLETVPTAPAEGDLLPDLVIGPPRQLRIETPLGREGDAALLAAGSNGCGADEVAEEGGRRCLRFASDIGNAGVGALELFMRKDEALAARAGAASAAWVQRVHQADGTAREVPVSEAEYHPTHGHYHIQAFAQTFLYAYDEETGMRGELLRDGGKTGFCVVDGGPVSLQATLMAPPAFLGGSGCCYMAVFCEMDAVSETEEFLMGISAGWFDVYPWWRSGQYVDISGIEDGVYELLSVVNPEGNVVEQQPGNDRGGAVFRLTGNEVELLSTWTEAPEGSFAWSGAHEDA